ncbi:MAG: DUF6390 family protein [bacterium]
MSQQAEQFSSVLTCARYAFKPNQLNYCGPDKNNELFEYLKAGETDGGLELILKKFETLYPYLKLIANSNKIENPFDKKVSGAYWVGNEMLENSGPAKLYYHLADGLNLKKKLSPKEICALKNKMAKGANPHHSFHVFNIWQRTGHTENPHTLFTMDECRIGWGKVVAQAEKIITVVYEPLIFNDGKLSFGAPTAKSIFYELNNQKVLPGNWISFHWSSFCEVLSFQDLENLQKWTTINLHLANL